MEQVSLLSAEEYAEVCARLARFSAWLHPIRGGSGWGSYKPEDVPEDCRVTNEERSAVEVYEFVNDPPEKYFAYISEKGALTTWMGDFLGSVEFGASYRDSFGGKRVPIRVQAINGKRYHGTYFESSGNYARIRVCKGG